MRVCGTFSCQTQTPFTLIMASESKISPNSDLVSWPSLKVYICKLLAGVQVSRQAEGPGAAEVENPHQ